MSRLPSGPGNDLLRGLYDIMIHANRSRAGLVQEAGMKPDTVRRWWTSAPRTIRGLCVLADLLHYRLMFVHRDHPLSVTALPIIPSPFFEERKK